MSTTFRKAGTLLKRGDKDSVRQNSMDRCKVEQVVRRQNTPGWFVVLAEEIKALIWDRHPALIWVDRAEGEVLCSSLTFGQHIEKGGFPAVDRVRNMSTTVQ